MRFAPSHSTATLEALIARLTVGKMADMSRPAVSDVAVSSSLAAAKRRRLLWLAHEGPHHPDAGDLLAQDPVDLVDALLHDLERRHHLADDDAEDHRRDRDADGGDDGQADVLVEGQRNGGDQW